MNKTLIGVLAFAVGAAIGSAVTWKVLKTKYEEIAQEEIDSVKDEYADLMRTMRQKLKESVKYDESQESEDGTEETAETGVDDEYYPDDDEREFTEQEKQQIEYYKLTSKYRSTDNDKSDEKDDEEGGNGEVDEDGVQWINGPYVITAEEFSCSPPGYNAMPLDYFADGVLADDWGVIMDIEETIGEDSLEHFGDDEDDILYVRNEREEIDYEVTRDPRTYAEAVQANPDPYYGK